MRQEKDFKGSESGLAALRLPKGLRARARKRARERDMNFSQLMRKALRRELGEAEPELAESNSK